MVKEEAGRIIAKIEKKQIKKIGSVNKRKKKFQRK